MIRLAYIVPTIGRPTLAATLESLDGVRALIQDTPGERDWGAANRNRGLESAWVLGYTHVAYMDDDDVATPGAATAILAGIEADPGALHVFRMRLPDGRVLWRERELVLGNLGTPCLVHPANIAARWVGTTHSHDIIFAVDVARELGRVCWHEDVVCDVKSN